MSFPNQFGELDFYVVVDRCYFPIVIGKERICQPDYPPPQSFYLVKLEMVHLLMYLKLGSAYFKFIPCHSIVQTRY